MRLQTVYFQDPMKQYAVLYFTQDGRHHFQYLNQYFGQVPDFRSTPELDRWINAKINSEGNRNWLNRNNNNNNPRNPQGGRRKTLRRKNRKNRKTKSRKY